MIVQGGLIDAVLLEARHHRGYFAFQQNQITHHHRMIGNPLEGYPRAESERRLERDPVQRHAEITARKAEPYDAARTGCALPTERVFYSAPVGRCRPRCPSGLSGCSAGKQRSSTADKEESP